MRAHLSSLWFVAITICTVPFGYAQDGRDPTPDETIVGTMSLYSKTICLDNRTRNELDRLAPQLAAIKPGTIIKIEGSSSFGATREEQVRNSFYLALQAQRYLRTKHALKAELLYLAAAPTQRPAKGNTIRIVKYPDNFRALHLSTERSEK
ncbi:hypothetical protein GURASL_21640 [Geotalea uraniireducens]|uniref:OmpA-like domain-containing protein n=1 Tax=Geotalea uraniireducens TaxID=351604 RepID=A0ABM8ELY8_9BACT|nr:hypothetical protein [Geotalea uraniireducens]BDV43241.1 hypothetical protein GURASL_21640 [Geotalea uraniireducens]